MMQGDNKSNIPTYIFRNWTLSEKLMNIQE